MKKGNINEQVSRIKQMMGLNENVIYEMDRDEFTRKFNVPDSKYGAGELVKVITSFVDGDISLTGVWGQHEDGLAWFMPIKDGVEIDERIIRKISVQGYAGQYREFINKYNRWALEERKLEVTHSSNYMGGGGSVPTNAKWWEEGIEIPELYPYVTGRVTRVEKI